MVYQNKFGELDTKLEYPLGYLSHLREICMLHVTSLGLLIP